MDAAWWPAAILADGLMGAAVAHVDPGEVASGLRRIAGAKRRGVEILRQQAGNRNRAEQVIDLRPASLDFRPA
jgi:hypothetical protein